MSLSLHNLRELPREHFGFVSKGRDRTVFSIEGHPTILAKVLNPGRAVAQKVLEQEDAFWRSHARDDAVPVARVLGHCETVLGTAQITEALRDETDAIAPNLSHLLQTNAFTGQHLDALNDFVRAAIAHHVTFSDFSLPNLVFGRRSAEAKPRIYAVDGFGDKSFIQIKHWFRWANTPHILRKFGRVPDGCGLSWDRKGRMYRFSTNHET